MSHWTLKLKSKRKRRSWSLDKTNARICQAFSDPWKTLRDIGVFDDNDDNRAHSALDSKKSKPATENISDKGSFIRLLRKDTVEEYPHVRFRDSSRISDSRPNERTQSLCESNSIRDNGSFCKDEDATSTSGADATKIDYLTEFFKVPVAVAGWFILGISISNLNKLILTSFEFNYPIALTTIQMLSSFCINHVLLTLTPLRRYNTPLPSHVLWQIYVLSALFAGSIALGNIGLKYLYVSFAKMIMATSPAVTVVLAKCMTGIQLTQRTYTSLIPLCGGTILCAVGEINFHWVGFAAMMGSTVLRAFRSIFEGRLLKEEKVNSLVLLYHISLPSSCLLALATIIWEGEDLMKERSNFTDFGFLFSILLSCFNGIFYNILTFIVTFYTSPLTLKVLGNGSILLNIAVSVFLFNHNISVTSVCGVMVTLFGIVLYQKSFMSGK